MSLDEPYADPSVVPSFKIANLISQQYKVAISGDGGDELLGGYNRISNSLNKNKKFSRIYKTLYKLQPSFIGTGASLLSKVKDFSISYSASLFDEKISILFKHLIRQRKIFKKFNSSFRFKL